MKLPKIEKLIEFLATCTLDADSPRRVRVNDSGNVVFLDAERRVSITISYQRITLKKFNEAGKQQKIEFLELGVLSYSQKHRILTIIDGISDKNDYHLDGTLSEFID